MVELISRQFQQLKSNLDEILAIKLSNSDDFVVQRTNVSLLFVAIKHCNRNVKYKIKDGREKLLSEKTKADVNRLQLQNLLYEVNHLKREIVRCHKFKSRDSAINLLSEDEYVKLGATLPVESYDQSKHSKHLMQLKLEFGIRKDLALTVKNLLASKEDLYKDIVCKTNRFSSFSPALRTLRVATKPLHDALEMTLEDDWKLGTNIQFLPKALYLLYMNLKAIQSVQSFGNFKLTTDIVGFDNQFVNRLLSKENTLLQKTNVRNENGNPVKDGVIPPIYVEPHNLSIQFNIMKPDTNDRICVNVFYFESVGLACAHSEFFFKDLSEMEVELTASDNLLGHLYTNDFGDHIPLSGINYMLEENGVDPAIYLKALKTKKFGKPYKWLQNLCSIFVFEHSKPRNEIQLQKLTRDVITKVKKRWISWMKLIKQLKGLSCKEIDTNGFKEHNYPCELSCSLVQWASISPEEFDNHNPHKLSLPKGGFIYSYFRAVIVRGSAKMECFIRISSNFPVDSPFWIICVHWNGRLTSSNCSAIKMMEYWTNTLSRKYLDSKCGLMIAQLLRTMYSFDVFLETEGSLQTAVEYVKEKPYISAFSKRLRCRPYKYIKKGTVYSFKQ